MDEYKKNEFIKAYDMYADAIFRYCFFRVYSRAQAEEITQDAFMKTWEYIVGGKDIKNIRAFLYRVASNSMIDAIRKHKESSLDEIMEESNAFEPSSEYKEDMEHAIMFKEIKEQLNRLKKEERDIIIMRHVEGFSPQEIAETFNISANNVSVKLNRATKKLRKQFGDYYNYER